MTGYCWLYKRLPVSNDLIGVQPSMVRKLLFAISLLILPVAISHGAFNLAIAKPATRPTAMAIHANGDFIAVGYEDGMLAIYNRTSSRVILTLTGHRSIVTSIGWHPSDTQLVTGSFDQTVKIWDIQSGQLLYTLRGLPSGFVTDVAWSPDGQHIIILQGGTDSDNFNVWDVVTQRIIYSEFVSTPSAIAWSHDASQFAVGYLIGALEIRNASDFRTKAYLRTRPENSPATLSGQGFGELAWHPNGNLLVAGTTVGQVIVWGSVSGLKRYELSGTPTLSHVAELDRVVSVWFCADGTTFSSVTGNGILRTWNVETGDLLSDTNLHTTFVVAKFDPTNDILYYIGADSDLQSKNWPSANCVPD